MKMGNVFLLLNFLIAGHPFAWAGWDVQTTPTTRTLYAVHFPVVAITGYAIGNSGTILKTTDGGISWAAQIPPTGSSIRSIHFPVDMNTGYAVGYSGTILKTTDGGTNWNLQFSGMSERLYDVYFLSESVGYAVGDLGAILKTTNGGATWSSQSTPISSDLRSVHFPVDDITGYAVGSSGRILKTTNGGSNWTLLNSGTSSTLWSVQFPVDEDTGYVAAGSGRILKTNDGGTSWSLQSSGVSSTLRGVHFPVDAATGYVVGYSGVILKTKDGGANWVQQISGIVSDLRGLHFPANSYVGYAVGNNGTILFTMDGGGDVIHDAGVVSIDAPGDTVFTNSIVIPVATVRNFGSVSDTFPVIVDIGAYTDTVWVFDILPDSTSQVIFADWQIPPGDSATYTMTVCSEVLNDLDPTNDCDQKIIFAHEGQGPVLLSAVASDNLIPIPGIDNDDQVLILFDEPTNRPVIDASNINTVLSLSGGHLWTDGANFIGGILWNMAGDGLWIILSTNSGLPTVVVGDTLFPDGVTIQDIWGNPAVSPVVITGSFDPPLGADEGSESRIPQSPFRLLQNVPNPFHSETSIRYIIPSSSDVLARNEAISVKLSIYNITGSLVETLVDEPQEPGFYKLHVTNNQLPGSGIYFYRLNARLGGEDLYTSTKRLILLK
ncbi:hypothetical protein IIA15_10800 [candidate division TA06 bacterium]|nr:hypothetical protein [candidate division TA06 bacterium]